MASEFVQDAASPVAPVEAPVQPVVEAAAEPAPAKRGRKPRAAVAAKVAKAPKAPRAKRVTAAKPAQTPKTSLKATAKKTAAKTATPRPAAKATGAFQTLKDTIMATKTTDFTATIKTAFGEAQAKAKESFAKSSELVTEATQFAKGNVEAVVESGKIFAEGSRKLGEELVAEAKGAFETINADFQQLAAVKSPTDLVKLQGEIARRNLEQAVAFTSKSSEAWMKLAGAAFAPLTDRFSLAMDKIKQAA